MTVWRAASLSRKPKPSAARRSPPSEPENRRARAEAVIMPGSIVDGHFLSKLVSKLFHPLQDGHRLISRQAHLPTKAPPISS